jgi:cell division protein FtsI/penicillin-binding protein 2
LSRAVAGIANDGVMPTPHFMLDVPNVEGTEKGWPTKRAISKKTAEQVTEMLTQVVTDGTGTAAKVPGYTVAGKTGTAQKALSGGRGYVGGKFVGSFIGFLPAEDPQVLVCVTMDEPKAGYYGGTVAAPTFAKLAQFSVEHLKVPPSSKKDAGDDEEDVHKPGIDTVSDGESKD